MNDNDKLQEAASLGSLDRLVHEPARLALLALLSVVDSADYTFLMNQLGLTWGNFSAHMTKLEQAGYIEVVKTFKGRRPNTMLRLTENGRTAFHAYRAQMKKLLEELPG